MKFLPIVAAVAILTLLVGCGRTPAPVLDLKIADGDWSDYHRSLQAISERLTPEERKEFDQALQEMKFQAMLGDGPSKAPEMRGDIRKQLAGLTVRDVLVLNCTIKLGRKKEQETALLRSILMNARLKTREGDDESARFLESTRQQQAKQLEALRADIAVITRRIDELNPTANQSGATIVPLDKLDEAPEFKKQPPPDKRKNA